MRLNCPDCGSQFDLIQAMEDADGRRFVDLIKDLPPMVIKPLVRYLRLFKPASKGLRWSRMLKLTHELAPMIRAAKVNRNGMVYVVTAQQWADVMTHLVDTPPKSLSLPLKTNGYLLEILVTGAEKAAALAEKQREERVRNRGRDGATEGAVSVASLLEGTTPKPENKSSPPPNWKKKAFNQGGDDNA